MSGNLSQILNFIWGNPYLWGAFQIKLGASKLFFQHYQRNPPAAAPGILDSLTDFARTLWKFLLS
jgi:hypothetical protein